MSAALRHPDWYLIAEQKFRKRNGVREIVQRFRGENFVILWDALTGQNMRLTPVAAALWRRLDGVLTVDALWRSLSKNPATAPTQQEVMDWVMQLVSAGFILSDHKLDPEYMTDRVVRKRDRLLETRFANPLAIKIGLIDPNRLLRWTYPFVRPFFSPLGGFVIAAIFIAALIVAALNWDALIGTADNYLLSQAGVLALFLAYPVMKALHELGHGWTVMHFGGEVREAGVIFLLFVPVPYVDASVATTFPNPKSRMLVGAAGIIVEFLIASLALFAWVSIEPGIEKAVLYSFMVMGTLSTALFNGNPLLKFDAYYVLTDWLEMPNLASRASEFLANTMYSRVFGLRPEKDVPADERKILLSYGVAALAYRISLTLLIVLIISRLYYVLGILLAFWAVIGGMIWPFLKTLWKGWTMAKRQNRERRFGWRALMTVLIIGGGAGFVPLPFSANGEGQIVPLSESELHAGVSGVIDMVSMPDGVTVTKGDLLLNISNPDQTARLELASLRLDNLSERLKRGGLGVAERSDLKATRAHAVETLQEAQAREAKRNLVAPISGRLAWVGGREPILGHFVSKGDRVGHIIRPDLIQIVLAFSPSFAGLLPEQGAMVSLLLPNGQEIERPLNRFRVLDTGAEVPQELLVSNGGTVAAQPGQPTHALSPVLVGWVAPQGDLQDDIGMRVAARIKLEPQPLAAQLMFHFRRLFLRATRV